MKQSGCDLCGKAYKLTDKQAYELEREGFAIYCTGCADRLGLNKWRAIHEKIKIYKM